MPDDAGMRLTSACRPLLLCGALALGIAVPSAFAQDTTTETSPYTTPTTETSPYTTPSTTPSTSTSTITPPPKQGRKDVKDKGKTGVKDRTASGGTAPGGTGGGLPTTGSSATTPAGSLAFTGADPLLSGAFGLALAMAATGLWTLRRRRLGVR